MFQERNTAFEESAAFLSDSKQACSLGIKGQFSPFSRLLAGKWQGNQWPCLHLTHRSCAGAQRASRAASLNALFFFKYSFILAASGLS